VNDYLSLFLCLLYQVVDNALYETLVQEVTSEKVKQHFEGLVEGEVQRYLLPNIRALNFVCKEALNGGGSASIRMDNLGKCFGANLLRMEIDIEEQLLEESGVGTERTATK
jgi:hypothetical protein